jgi:cob(I)alamin adenosyltransferase
MKIYTKSGDKGTTSLLSGSRVSKTSNIMSAVGSVDELNSYLGTVLSLITKHDQLILKKIMNTLFDIGAILASDGSEKFKKPIIKDEFIFELETEIDRLTNLMPPLKEFVLPVGNIHYARAVCRRAERDVITIHEVYIDHSMSIKYLNRLSDYLFTLARYYNYIEGLEIKWIPMYE